MTLLTSRCSVATYLNIVIKTEQIFNNHKVNSWCSLEFWKASLLVTLRSTRTEAQKVSVRQNTGRTEEVPLIGLTQGRILGSSTSHIWSIPDPQLLKTPTLEPSAPEITCFLFKKCIFCLFPWRPWYSPFPRVHYRGNLTNQFFFYVLASYCVIPSM